MADGTKKEGFIDFSEPQFMVQDVSYRKTLSAAQFFTYRPNEVKAFYAYETLWVSVKLNGKNQFAILKRDGGIREYVEFYKNETTAQLIDEQKWYWKANDKKFTNGAKFVMGFKTKMSDYVSDYKSLSKKIADKEKGYRMFGMNKILDEYNQWFAQNNPDFITVAAGLEAIIKVPEVIVAPTTDVPKKLIGKWDDGQNRILEISLNSLSIHYNDEYGGKWVGTILGVNTEKGVVWSNISKMFGSDGSRQPDSQVAGYKDYFLAVYYRELNGTLKFFAKPNLPKEKVYDLPGDGWFGVYKKVE